MSDKVHPLRAQIEHVAAAAASGDKAYVSLIVEYGGKEAKVQLQVDASEIERTALPKVIEEELRALVDALETIAEETAISFRV